MDRDRYRGKSRDHGYHLVAAGEEAGLACLGHPVVAAADGHEALDIVSSRDVALVMPIMGGEALLRHLREHNPALEVIAMTGLVTDRDVQQLKDAGFDDALPNPFSLEQLIARVGEVLTG